MTSYCVMIGEHKYEVNIGDKNLTVDGKPVNVDLIPLDGNGMHLLKRRRHALEMHFSPQDSRTIQMLVAGHMMEAKVVKSGLDTDHQTRSKNDGELTAPISGLIISVPVKKGEHVKKGQPLAVIESMKMQMQLRSEISGKVKSITVKPGQQVKKGKLLVRVA